MAIFDSVRSFWTETFAIPFGWAASALQIQIFGTQLWKLLLTLMVFSVFAGFIGQNAKGSGGVGRNAASFISSRVSRSSRSDDRKRDEWASYYENKYD